ncbi:beta-class carbonic anhydrase [Pelosinus propionicus]|uniref:carbonic anhydrase n=1 Tax=Pelosinus propionicus DSM 13327 TaxID=1123291 RepID=A0A1I4J8H1_9FIRM|nr:carbonic anhydrase [Pelosinus propionicus]SFL62888.1 carbonic anhydrase [Pelosinus propionicus DSM 13327]
MIGLEQLIKANSNFLLKSVANEDGLSKSPKHQIAIVTCMDTRLVELLESALGIKRGEAVVIKTAGTSTDGNFGAILRSLVIAIYALDVEEIVVVGHEDCGVTQISPSMLKQKMQKRGIDKKQILEFEEEAIAWLDKVHDSEEEVKKLVDTLRTTTIIPRNVPIHGLMIHPDTGEVSLLTDG